MFSIGIGGGAGCDGQVLVYQDMLQMSGDFKPKFTKHFAMIGDAMKEAFAAYDREVKDGAFPEECHSFVKSDCSDDFYAKMNEKY